MRLSLHRCVKTLRLERNLVSLAGNAAQPWRFEDSVDCNSENSPAIIGQLQAAKKHCWKKKEKEKGLEMSVTKPMSSFPRRIHRAETRCILRQTACFPSWLMLKECLDTAIFTDSCINKKTSKVLCQLYNFILLWLSQTQCFNVWSSRSQ